MILEIVLITCGFVLAAYLALLLADVLVLRKRRMDRRVATIATRPPQIEEAVDEAEAAVEERLPTLARLLSSRGVADRLLLKLIRAGIKLRPSEFIGLAAGIAFALGIIVILLTRNVGAEILAVAVGFLTPFVYVSVCQGRRLAAFSVQLPDALALMASAIRSGYGVQRAMQAVSEEMPAPISEEFQRVLNEVNVGWSIEAALMRLAQRIMSYDVELVVTAIIVQQEVGGNLAEIIDNIAATIRDRVRVEGEVAALTAEGRISGVVLIVLPIVMGVAISILNPSYLKPLVTEPLGIWLIVGGVCLQILGALIIRRMIAVDY